MEEAEFIACLDLEWAKYDVRSSEEEANTAHLNSVKTTQLVIKSSCEATILESKAQQSEQKAKDPKLAIIFAEKNINSLETLLKKAKAS